MPDLGAPELIIIAVVVLVLFGSKKLPEAARSLGRSLRIFRSEVKAMGDEAGASAGQAEVAPTASAPAVAHAAAPEPGPDPAPDPAQSAGSFAVSDKTISAG